MFMILLISFIVVIDEYVGILEDSELDHGDVGLVVEGMDCRYDRYKNEDEENARVETN